MKQKLLFLIAIMGSTAMAVGQEIDGIFFRVEGNGMKRPAYMLGTMHYMHKDFVHDVPGLDDALKAADCLATEISIDMMLHPEQHQPAQQTNVSAADMNLLRLKEQRLNSEFEELKEEGSNLFEKYLTKEQYDTLERAMTYLCTDQILEAQTGAAAPAGSRTYRETNPLALMPLARSLGMVRTVANYVMKGYSQEYEQLDIGVAMQANSIDQAFAQKHKGKHQIDFVALDSVYMWDVMNAEKSQSLLSDPAKLRALDTRRIIDMIYQSYAKQYVLGAHFEALDSLYRRGEGLATLAELEKVEQTPNPEMLLAGRNRYWMTQLPELLKRKKNVVVAVGLAHLLPTQHHAGILAELRKMGYKVTRIL